MDRQEAIDNLRVAIKASLLTVPQHEYRVWAQKYLEQTEPTMDGLSELRDRASDSIADLVGWQPWSNLGRAKDCWYAIQHICAALKRFSEENYQAACNDALDATKLCLTITERSKKLVAGFAADIEMSMYGESFTTRG